MNYGALQRDVAIADLVDAYKLTLDKVQAGDIGVAHSKGFLGWLIRIGTGSYWNHAFGVVDPGDGTPETIQVIQAEAHGVELTTLDKVAPGGEVNILSCPTGVSRPIVVRELKALLRTKYAFVTDFCIGVSIIAKKLHIPLRFTVRENSTLICSAVVTLALFNAGYNTNPPDLYSVTPAEVAMELGSSAALAAKKAKRYYRRRPRKQTT